MTRSRLLDLLAIAAVVLACFWQLGAVPLLEVDEGAFSEATREMLASGNFVSTTLDGEPRHDKPILIYWLQAASVSLLGLNELALPTVPGATTRTGVPTGAAMPIPLRGMRVLLGPACVPNWYRRRPSRGHASRPRSPVVIAAVRVAPPRASAARHARASVSMK